MSVLVASLRLTGIGHGQSSESTHSSNEDQQIGKVLNVRKVLRKSENQHRAAFSNNSSVFHDVLSSRGLETSGFVRIPLTDERLRALCAKALTADESEAATVLAELRMALREHNEYLRALALEVLNHSSSKAAD